MSSLTSSVPIVFFIGKERRLKLAGTFPLHALHLGALQLLDASCRRGPLFGRSSALLKDETAHRLPHVEVRLIGGSLAGDALAPQFLFRLGGAEEIGGQLRGAHVVEDVLAARKTLPRGDVTGALASVQAHVAVVLKH